MRHLCLQLIQAQLTRHTTTFKDIENVDLTLIINIELQHILSTFIVVSKPQEHILPNGPPMIHGGPRPGGPTTGPPGPAQPPTQPNPMMSQQKPRPPLVQQQQNPEKEKTEPKLERTEPNVLSPNPNTGLC